MSESMKVQFWGVRGSIPSAGPTTQKYGGNTSCIEIRADDRLIIVDAGSGIRSLGNHIMAHDLPKGPIDADIFLTHTHWDHIMGFPFFTPIYVPGTKLRVHGPVSFEDDPLDEVVGGQMKYRYFPINMGELASEIKYDRLQENPEIDLGRGLILRTKIINHPITTLGYRFEFGGKSVCTCYDTEPYRNLFITDPDDPAYDAEMAEEGEIVAAEMNEMLAEFLSGADLLIFDSQYTKEEYETRYVGWGHSHINAAIETGAKAGVKKLALFHHDPDRTDDELDSFAEKFCGEKDGMEIFFAREGVSVDL